MNQHLENSSKVVKIERHDVLTSPNKPQKRFIGGRIRNCREQRGVSRDQLAERLGITRSSLQFYEQGEREPKPSVLIEMAVFFGVDPGWLLTGESPAHTPSPPTPEADETANARPSLPHGNTLPDTPRQAAWAQWAGSIDRYAFVPVIYAPRLCAAGTDMRDYEYHQGAQVLMFTPRFLKRLGVQPHEVFCIPIKGNAMEPTLRDGAVIMVDTTQRHIREGIYALRVGDDLIVRRMERTLNGVIRVRSDNTIYEGYEIAPTSTGEYELDVIGRVVQFSSMI